MPLFVPDTPLEYSISSYVDSTSTPERDASIAAYINSTFDGSQASIQKISDAAQQFGVTLDDISRVTGYNSSDLANVFSSADTYVPTQQNIDTRREDIKAIQADELRRKEYGDALRRLGMQPGQYYISDITIPESSAVVFREIERFKREGGLPSGNNRTGIDTGYRDSPEYLRYLTDMAARQAGQSRNGVFSVGGGATNPSQPPSQTTITNSPNTKIGLNPSNFLTGAMIPAMQPTAPQSGGMTPTGGAFARYSTQPQSLSGNFQTSTQLADPTVRAAYIDNLNFANAVAERPYEQYGGPRIADFSADQQAAFANTRAAAAGPQNFLQGNIQAYQNPYTQQVIDTTMGDIDRARQLQQQQVNAQALSRGAFGGSRQAVAESENSRNFLDQQARTAAQLRNQGFNTAADLLNTDINRNVLANQQLLAQGNQQQAQVQANYNLANQDFQSQFNYPLQQLQIRSAALGVQPYGGDRSTQTPVYQNNLATTLGALGAGTSILQNLGLAAPVGNFLGGLGSSALSGLSGLFGSGSSGSSGLPVLSQGFDINQSF